NTVVTNRRQVFFVQQAKAHAFLRLHRRMQAHRDVHEPERQGTGPQWSHRSLRDAGEASRVDAVDALREERFATVVLSTVCPHHDVETLISSRASECGDDASE